MSATTSLGLHVSMDKNEFEEFQNKIESLPFIKKLNNEYLIEGMKEGLDIKFSYCKKTASLLINYYGEVGKRFNFICSLPITLMYKERLILLGIKSVELSEGVGIVFQYPAQLGWYNFEIADTGKTPELTNLPLLYIPQTIHAFTPSDIVKITNALR